MTANTPPILPYLGRRLSSRQAPYLVALALLFLFYLFYSLFLPRAIPVPIPLPKSPLAPRLTARELLSRPISQDWTTIPKIIHQTWFPAGSDMSDDAKSWVQTVRSHNPEWEYVLWDDKTNEELVRQHFPWFLEAYSALPFEINRADVARNLYMYAFGGMYADVDTEALRPVDPLFAAHSTTLSSHLDLLSSSTPPPTEQKQGQGNVQRAFMGRMAHSTDLESAAAVPNGWMASPPGHPFWLLPVLAVVENPKGDGTVEGLTGPGVLGPLLNQYFAGFKNEVLRRHVCERIQRLQPSWQLFCNRPADLGVDKQVNDSLVLLPREQIYPYSWVDNRDLTVCQGANGNPDFDPVKCKELVEVDAWPSYFITYCTHKW